MEKLPFEECQNQSQEQQKSLLHFPTGVRLKHQRFLFYSFLCSKVRYSNQNTSLRQNVFKFYVKKKTFVIVCTIQQYYNEKDKIREYFNQE